MHCDVINSKEISEIIIKKISAVHIGDLDIKSDTIPKETQQKLVMAVEEANQKLEMFYDVHLSTEDVTVMDEKAIKALFADKVRDYKKDFIEYFGRFDEHGIEFAYTIEVQQRVRLGIGND